ncbi:hypothetical protein Sme01_40600 [Sphaerisporangium melleum]|uniref:Uncharacterized protein n=1 Tax=Sphaerisporangium melleum TaxID=321316 RepID=A0A917RDH0_9ACTN|nr:hypothetical protein GCM10007964_48400 [Sphaerisporangium melleum]GII71584.1 hypothetical protein Sme01_40600 [Sphaerisporangium melleum]
MGHLPVRESDFQTRPRASDPAGSYDVSGAGRSTLPATCAFVRTVIFLSPKYDEWPRTGTRALMVPAEARPNRPARRRGPAVRSAMNDRKP